MPTPVEPLDLTLRPLTHADCDELLTWADCADALLQWTGSVYFTWPWTREQIVNDLEAADANRLLFAAEVDGELVGQAMLTVLPAHRNAVVGRVAVAPSHRGRGLGVALMEAVSAYGFDRLGLHRLELAVFDFNQAAIDCYSAVGYRIEGTRREAARASTGFWNTHVMGLLEHEYRARSAAARSAGAD